MRTGSRAQTIAGLAAVLLLVALGLLTLHEFLPAIVWAVIFAVAIWPQYARAAMRWPRLSGIVLPLGFTTLVALVFILPLAFVVVPVTHEAHEIARWVATAQRTGVPAPHFLERLPFGSHLVPLWQDNLGDPAKASKLFGRMANSGVLQMSGEVGSLVLHRLVLFGFTLLTLFFLFRDGERIADRMLRAMRRMFGPAGERVGRQLVASVHGTVDGLVLVGIGEGVLLWVVYELMGVPRPTLFGLFTAILSMIPFGAAVAFWLAGGLLLAFGKVGPAIVVVVCGLLVTFVADHFVRPSLIGNATQLPFLWVLFGILGGISTFGLLGLFAGPAIMAVLILLWREWVGDEEGPLNA